MARREWLDKHYGTLAYFQYTTWNNLLKSVINSGSAKPDRKTVRQNSLVLVTREQYYRWCKRQEALILAIYKEGLKPTLWRKNENGNFEFGNIYIGIKQNGTYAWKINFGALKRKVAAQKKGKKK
jgi:hypothetical protein